MMAFEDCPSQIVKMTATRFTMIPLTMHLCLIATIFVDVLAVASWTPFPLRPAQFANFFVTTRIVDEVLDIHNTYAGSILRKHVYFLWVTLPRRKYVIQSLESSGL